MFRKDCAPRQLRISQLPREFDDRQWVPAGVVEYARGDVPVEGGHHRRLDKGRRIGDGEWAQLQAIETVEQIWGQVRVANGEDHADRIRLEATGNKGQRRERLFVEPLRVVHDAYERSIVRHFAQQRERRKTHEKQIGRRSGVETEDGVQGCLLPSGSADRRARCGARRR